MCVCLRARERRFHVPSETQVSALDNGSPRASWILRYTRSGLDLYTSDHILRIVEMSLTVPLLLVFVASDMTSYAQHTCVAGPHHKKVPSAEVNIPEGTACHSFADLSCCTAKTADSVHREGDSELYKFHWDHCGAIPEACHRYLKAESCFFECDPYLGPWKGEGNGSLLAVPICGSYCDEWFEACKNVPLCAGNWLTDFVFNNASGFYDCSNQICHTFATWYRNGTGLCETMWGDSFLYDKDDSNCMKMMFDGRNPNQDVRAVSSQKSVSESARISAIVLSITLYSFLGD